MSKTRIELHKDGDHMSIVTNADSEHDFWESFCELLGSLIAEDVESAATAPNPDDAFVMAPNYGGDWEFQLRHWLPQATEIACRLRGYKSADVHEERIIISGWGIPNHKRHEIGPSPEVAMPNPFAQETAE